MSEEIEQQGWSASLNEEDGFSEIHPTKEDAVRELIYGMDVEAGMTIYVGPIKRPQVDLKRRILWIWDEAIEIAGEEWPECVYDAVTARARPELVNELGAEIQAVVDVWAKRHNIYGTSFIVETQSYTVTDEDIAAIAKAESK